MRVEFKHDITFVQNQCATS